MTPLADAIVAILDGEREYPAVTAAALSRVLHVTGYSGRIEPVPEDEIEAALVELIAAGSIEAIWRRGTAHYRMIKAPAAVVADAGNRT